MRIAYFPKNKKEVSLFAPKFNSLGIEFDVFSPNDTWLSLINHPQTGSGPSPDLNDLAYGQVENMSFSSFDLIFQRPISSWLEEYGPRCFQFFFETMWIASQQVPVINHPRSIYLSARKHLCLSILSKNDLPIVPFFVSPNPIRNIHITNSTIHSPCVIKALQSAGGIGVMLAKDDVCLGDTLSLFHMNKQPAMIQPYIPSSYDIRILLVGNEIIAAIKRQGSIYKHNISLGATAEALDKQYIPAEMAEDAIKASEVLNLDIAGVDILDTSEGHKLLEVNPSPSFEATARASGVDVTGAISRHLIGRAKA